MMRVALERVEVDVDEVVGVAAGQAAHEQDAQVLVELVGVDARGRRRRRRGAPRRASGGRGPGPAAGRPARGRRARRAWACSSDRLRPLEDALQPGEHVGPQLLGGLDDHRGAVGRAPRPRGRPPGRSAPRGPSRSPGPGRRRPPRRVVARRRRPTPARWRTSTVASTSGVRRARLAAIAETSVPGGTSYAPALPVAADLALHAREPEDPLGTAVDVVPDDVPATGAADHAPRLQAAPARLARPGAGSRR